jgi:hypothetical protein
MNERPPKFIASMRGWPSRVTCEVELIVARTTVLAPALPRDGGGARRRELVIVSTISIGSPTR